MRLRASGEAALRVCCVSAGPTATPNIKVVPPVRERRPLAAAVKMQLRRNANRRDGAAGTGTPTSGRHRCAKRSERRVPRAPVRMMLNVGVPAERRTTPALGVLLCRPPAAGGADRRSAFPCLRVAPPSGLDAETRTILELRLHAGRALRADPNGCFAASGQRFRAGPVFPPPLNPHALAAPELDKPNEDRRSGEPAHPRRDRAASLAGEVGLIRTTFPAPAGAAGHRVPLP